MEIGCGAGIFMGMLVRTGLVSSARAFFSAMVTIIGACPVDKATGATVCFLCPGILK